MEAEYPKSFGYNPRPSPASMTLFGLKTQIMSFSTGFPGCPNWGGGRGVSTPKPEIWLLPSPPPPPPPQKVQAFNCPRVFFSAKFNKSSPNLLSLQETLIKTMDKVSRNSTQVWSSISIIITKIVNLNENSQNGGEVHLHMNKKQNDYQNVNQTPLFYEIALFFLFCMTWGPKKTFWCLLFIV